MTDDATADWKQDLRTAYDRDAERRDATTIDAWRAALLDELVEHVPPEARVLDVGCGTGQLAGYLAASRLVATGVDLSPQNVEAARARGVPAVVGDLMDLPFEDASFDAALAFNVLLHVPADDLPAALTEVRRVLTESSLFLWVVWGGHDHDGTADDEWLDPPRRFVNHSDETFAELPTPGFERLATRFLHEEQTDTGHHPQVALLRAT